MNTCRPSFLSQTTELSNRIKIAEKQVKKLVSEEFITSPSPTRRQGPTHPPPDREDPEAHRKRDTLHQDGGSDDDDTDEEGTTLTDDESTQSLDALEEQFRFLEEEVATLVADVHDLALYTKLNITGFMKILKVCIFIISVLVRYLFTGFPTGRNTMCVTMPIHVHFPLDPVYTPHRNKPRLPLPRRSFRIISRSALSISTTGMQ